MPPHAAKVLLPFLIFSTFKGDNCQKNYSTSNFNTINVREWKLKISYFLVSLSGTTLSKSTDQLTNFKPDLRIPMTYLHMQFQHYTCNQTKVWERKLKTFSEIQGVTVKKIHHTKTKSELDLRNSKMYPYVRFEWNVCNHRRDENGNWKFLFFSLIIYCFTSCSRIFHLYGDVTFTGEGLQNLGLCLALKAFQQVGIFIVPHLMWHGASVFPVPSEGLPHSVTFYDTHGDVDDLF